MVWNQNFSCLGTGLPYAVGASIADGGKRPVLFTTSDSAFLYHIAELEVAHRFNLPIATVVAVLVLMIYLALLPAPPVALAAIPVHTK